MVAMLCLVPVPFEAFASSVCREVLPSWRCHARKLSAVTLAASGTLCMGTAFGWFQASPAIFLTELTLLQIALALIAPLNVSRLYQHKHTERSLVLLEWAKAYAGRLLWAIVTLATHSMCGFEPLLAMLFVGIFVVAATA